MYEKLKGGTGIPQIYWSGSDAYNNILIIELLGPSLQRLFNVQNKKFSLLMTITIGIKVLNILEYIHN